ncbi:MAG TPA: cupin domain-containing protein [Candidatus Binatia bacterium]|nr:cupin domain-containing protein [Candidatus Binatia bacterium]
MATVDSSQVDDVQIFDVAEAMKKRDHLSGRVDMAKSPNSFIAVFQTKPRGGETHIHQHPDSDQILFILKGELTVEGLSGKYVLRPNQGVLIPAGVHYGFTNTTQEDVVFLTMRTESSGGRRVAYVPNVPSNIHVKIPAEEIGAKGFGRHIYVYAMDRSTIGISPLLMEEWNKGSLLRMNCEYEKQNGAIIAKLPQRMAQWFRIENLTESDYRLLTEPEKIRVRVDLTPLLQKAAVR